MKFFIIGPTGSIGQELVPHLISQGHEVVGLTRTQENAKRLANIGGEPINGDIATYSAWQNAAANADCLINLCSVPTTRGTMKWVREFGSLNTAASRGLLDAARKGGNCRSFIMPSLVHMIGDHGSNWVDEDTAPMHTPIAGVYEPSEQAVMEAQRNGIPAIVLRFGTIYSPNPQGTFAKTFMTAIAKGQFRYPGGGENFFPLVSMTDAVAAIAKAAETSASAPFLNIVDDQPLPLKEVVALLAQPLGKEAKSMPRWLLNLIAGNVMGGLIGGSFRVKNAKAKEMLMWQPKHPSLRNQADELVAAYKSRDI